MSVAAHRRAWPVLAAALVLTGLLGGCGDGNRAAATPSVDPTLAQLQAQLDALPTVDGATRTAREQGNGTLLETFTVPAGTAACLQVLSRLDAGGFAVVAGANADPVDPTSCRAAATDTEVGTGAGRATVLAQGGSQIGLTWTATQYSLEASTG